MNDPHAPQSWASPDWNADYGDCKSELELRLLAISVLATIAQSAVKLEIPETGLMYLSISLPDGPLTEVHSLAGADRVERRFGIFPGADTPGEDELYADSVDDAVRLIAGHKV